MALAKNVKTKSRSLFWWVTMRKRRYSKRTTDASPTSTLVENNPFGNGWIANKVVFNMMLDVKFTTAHHVRKSTFLYGLKHAQKRLSTITVRSAHPRNIMRVWSKGFIHDSLFCL